MWDSLTLKAAGEAGSESPDDVTESIVFETHVQPILREKCVKCHGDKNRQAGLNLAAPDAVIKGGESGPGIVPGDPQGSLFYEKISEREMPPEGSPALMDEEISVIRAWIATGARFLDSSTAARQVTQHDIVPLMLLRCSTCHGGRRREGDLDLRTKESMLRGGKSGAAVIPGKPGESRIVQRIKSAEMPPRRMLVSASVKPMKPSELELLEMWIAQGMPESSVASDVFMTDPDPLVSDEDRQFWSFQPPRTGPIPSVDNKSRIRNPIDAFVLEKLEEVGLSLSSESDRRTLLRRAYFDLVGLPPPVDEVRAFVSDQNPLAYERLLDRLLASPRYGERWGSHWLDVAGYADSEGGQNADKIRPHIWRYRDYVIRALNVDKPYDRFLHEQIAGDELTDYENAEVIDESVYDNLVATAFMATAEDRTFADITNFVPDRLEVIADEIQIFGSAVLGLTINCARCHSHKFDPIPQRDYYRLSAIFKDGLDEYDWLKPQGPRTLNYVTSVEREAWESHEAEINEQIDPVKKQLESEQEDAKKEQLEERIKQLEEQRRPEPRIRAVWSRGVPSPTYLLVRGSHLTPGRLVQPGVPSILNYGKKPFAVEPPWPEAGKTGRRLALARWLTHPDHPLTARVMVNRIWQHHFGRGIVATPGNFGTAGAAPTHQMLLDWLAREFVRRSWSVKQIHRLMMTAGTYRQSSRITSDVTRVDPEGKLFSAMPMRRMDAEVLRDSLLWIAGQLDFRPGGPADPVEEREDGLVTSTRTNPGWRRSIYVLHRRTKIPTILENFDLPQMGPNCVNRGESIVAPQALHLLNNATVYELAEHFAERVRRKAGSDRDAQIDHVHLLALGRMPSDEERSLAQDAFEELIDQRLEKLAAGDQEETQRKVAERALVPYCHAVFNSAAFVYID